jgi:hypothetical protein
VTSRLEPIANPIFRHKNCTVWALQGVPYPYGMYMHVHPGILLDGIGEIPLETISYIVSRAYTI